MKTKIIRLVTCWAVLGLTLLSPAFAQPGPGSSQGSGQGNGYGNGPGGGPGWSLMSPAERDAHWTAMRASKTVEECKAAQAKQRALIEERAKERGIALPAAPANACERIMAGGQQGAGPRAGKGPGGGAGRGPGADLLSSEEMAAHRNAMRAAKTVEECKALQAEHRALLENRAKDKGVSLPVPRANACERIMASGQQGAGPGGGPRAGKGPGSGPGRGPAADLLTSEEMVAHRNAMRAAKTVEECKSLQAEHRALMENRAKDKGVTLPEPRQQGCDRMQARGLIQ